MSLKRSKYLATGDFVIEKVKIRYGFGFNLLRVPN